MMAMGDRIVLREITGNMEILSTGTRRNTISGNIITEDILVNL